jgi:hypothetical protein
MFNFRLVITFGLVLFVLSINPLTGFPPEKDQPELKINSQFRAFYLNDQRLQWSGMEATFGTEGDIMFQVKKAFTSNSLSVVSHLFLNQRFGENQLRDEVRDRYLQNFAFDTLTLARLYLEFNLNKVKISLGKRYTVFGKNNSLVLSNRYIFQPFIRNEAVLRFETGLFARFTAGMFDLNLAVVNGETDMDTNSSKAGILRIGLEGRNWGIGISGKIQDGIGSEQQKYFNNHLGFDFRIQLGRLLLSGEAIYDEYGFRKPFLEDDVFWQRSLYYRQIFYKLRTPITGYGGYLDLIYQIGNFTLNLNYGEYYPKEIGHPYHDDPIKRAIAKGVWQLKDSFEAFMGLLWESERTTEPLFKGASDFALIFGVVYQFRI